jgi:uncharacterized metal-binding protein
MKFQCAYCEARACCEEPDAETHPMFCPERQCGEIVDGVRDEIGANPALAQLLATSARTEATGYPTASRLENTLDFARRLGATKLGIATCVGLLDEARIAQEIFESHGFEVFSVCCKVGGIPKEDVGVLDAEKIHPGSFEPICDPVAQARLLNHAGTQLNVVVGLCVGHDSIFFQHSAAPATVLIAKDRATGHNPVAVLHTARTYYRRVWGPGGAGSK